MQIYFFETPLFIAYGERIYPELIGPNLTLDHLVYESNWFLSSEGAQEDCRKKCLELCTLLSVSAPQEVLSKTLKSLLTQ